MISRLQLTILEMNNPGHTAAARVSGDGQLRLLPACGPDDRGSRKEWDVGKPQERAPLRAVAARAREKALPAHPA